MSCTLHSKAHTSQVASNRHPTVDSAPHCCSTKDTSQCFKSLCENDLFHSCIVLVRQRAHVHYFLAETVDCICWSLSSMLASVASSSSRPSAAHGKFSWPWLDTSPSSLLSPCTRRCSSDQQRAICASNAICNLKREHHMDCACSRSMITILAHFVDIEAGDMVFPCKLQA